MCFDHMIITDTTKALHVKNTNKAVYSRPEEHRLNLSPEKSRVGMTTADLLTPTVCPSSLLPNEMKA